MAMEEMLGVWSIENTNLHIYAGTRGFFVIALL
jgi:hypothetical protein